MDCIEGKHSCLVVKPVNVLCLCLQVASIKFMDIDTKVKATTNEHINTLLRKRDTSTYFSRVTDIFSEIVNKTDLHR